MLPPGDVPSVIVATMEDMARRMGLDPGDLWAYLYRQVAPPPEIRAALVEAFFPRVSPDDFLKPGDPPIRLTSPHQLATLATPMQATIATRGQKVSRSRLEPDNRRHPFVRALVAKGKTVTEFARTLGYSRSTVQSWYDAGEGNGRPIPRKAAEAIRKQLGVPLTAWSRVVD